MDCCRSSEASIDKLGTHKVRCLSHHWSKVGSKREPTNNQAFKSTGMHANRRAQSIDLVWLVVVPPQALQQRKLGPFGAVVPVVYMATVREQQGKGTMMISQGHTKDQSLAAMFTMFCSRCQPVHT